jgi:hypothetical protein
MSLQKEEEHMGHCARRGVDEPGPELIQITPAIAQWTGQAVAQGYQEARETESPSSNTLGRE